MVLSNPSGNTLVCTAAMHLTDLFIFHLLVQSFFDPSIIWLIFLPCPLPIFLYAILLNLCNFTNLSLLASLSPWILYLFLFNLPHLRRMRYLYTMLLDSFNPLSSSFAQDALPLDNVVRAVYHSTHPSFLSPGCCACTCGSSSASLERPSLTSRRNRQTLGCGSSLMWPRPPGALTWPSHPTAWPPSWAWLSWVLGATPGRHSTPNWASLYKVRVDCFVASYHSCDV